MHCLVSLAERLCVQGWGARSSSRSPYVMLVTSAAAFARLAIEAVTAPASPNKGLERGTNRILVEIGPRYLRPTEVDLLLGDATKARENLGWTPTTTFEELVDLMVDHDVELAADEAHLKTRR